MSNPKFKMGDMLKVSRDGRVDSVIEEIKRLRGQVAAQRQEGK